MVWNEPDIKPRSYVDILIKLQDNNYTVGYYAGLTKCWVSSPAGKISPILEEKEISHWAYIEPLKAR